MAQASLLTFLLQATSDIAASMLILNSLLIFRTLTRTSFRKRFTSVLISETFFHLDSITVFLRERLGYYNSCQ